MNCISVQYSANISSKLLHVKFSGDLTIVFTYFYFKTVLVNLEIECFASLVKSENDGKITE